MRVTAGSYSNVVDMYNRASDTWSTAQLSVARFGLAATSVGNVAIFAGGYRGYCSFALYDGGFASDLLCVDEACFRRVIVAAFVMYAVQQGASDEGHCRKLFQCCGHVQQCIGHMVDCSAQCGTLWACSDVCWERGHLRGG
jgi:hypothetical protein